MQWLPVIASAACVALFVSYYFLFQIEHEEFALDRATELENKIVFAGSSFALILSLLWAWFVGFFLLRHYYSKMSLGGQTLVSVCVVAGISVGSILVFSSSDAGGGLAAWAIAQVDGRGRFHVQSLLTITNWMTMVAAVLNIAVCYALAAPKSTENMDDLSDAITAFKLSLYSASILLVAGIIEIGSFFQWAAAAWYDDQAESVRSLSHGENAGSRIAEGMILTAGLVFTTSLIVVYAPSAMKLHERLTALTAKEAQRNPDTFDVAKWNLIHRVDSSPLSAFGSYLAFALPLLTSFLSKWFKLG